LTASNSPANDTSMTDNEDSGPVRLQVFLAHAGVASRRNAEEIILSGRVSVNGSTVTSMGSKVMPGDDVRLDGKKVEKERVKRYVLLHKPVGHVSSLSDEKGRPVAADLLREAYSERLYNVGRLDMYSSGALLFTNDGQFALSVGHPSAGIEKEYVVEASLPFNDEVIRAFERGVRVDSVFYRCERAERLTSRKIRVVLVEGKNREIRRVLDHFGIRVKHLSRVRIGPVSLEGLNPGEFRELTAREIEALLADGERGES